MEEEFLTRQERKMGVQKVRKAAEPPFNFDDLFNAAASELLAAFQRSSNQARPDEVGAPRERQIRRFMEDWLPERYGVSHGYVISRAKRASKQIDCIIYDAATCPKYLQDKEEDRRLVPIGHTYGAVEVKSTLGSKELNDALEKVESVANLSSERHGGWHQKKIEVCEKGADGRDQWREMIVRERRPARIPVTAIVAFRLSRGMKLSDVREACMKGRRGPDFVLVLDSGCLIRETEISLLRIKSLLEKDELGPSLDTHERLKLLRHELAGSRDYVERPSKSRQCNLMTFFAVYLDLINSLHLPKYPATDLLSVWRSKQKA